MAVLRAAGVDHIDKGGAEVDWIEKAEARKQQGNDPNSNENIKSPLLLYILWAY